MGTQCDKAPPMEPIQRNEIDRAQKKCLQRRLRRFASSQETINSPFMSFSFFYSTALLEHAQPLPDSLHFVSLIAPVL